MKIRLFLMFLVCLALALAACSDGNDSGGSGSGNGGGGTSSGSNNNGGNGDPFGGWPFDNSGESLVSTPGYSSLNIPNLIEIKYNGNGVDINNPHSGVSTSETNGTDVVVKIIDTSTYNLVLSGATASGSLKVYGDVRKGLYLNGVSITNGSGPAINIQKSGRVTVHLVSGTENFLTDGPSYATPPNRPDGTPEQAKGTFFSEGKLLFDGSGSLEVRGKYNHAIVVDNDIEVTNGKIVVSEAVNDGIHANDKIEVKGGFLKISSTGDAIQSEREDLGNIVITGGKIAASTTGPKSHGIASEKIVTIRDNALIQISVSGNGSKGIRARSYVEFLGGKTLIQTKGTLHPDPDSDDESTPVGIRLDGDLFIEGGEVTVKSIGDKAKGINTHGNATIEEKNGNTVKVNVEADDDGLKVRGNLSIKSGTVSVESKKKNALDVTGTSSGTNGSNVTLKNGGN
jgi:hypothetical protein